MNINTTIAEDSFVSLELWGKDHWSTLAYIETKLVDGDGYCLQFDPHMRQNRRTFRVLAEGAANVRNGVAMSPEHGSRLADDTYLPWHDDWCCVQDMVEAGLFQPGEWEPGFPLILTEKGLAFANALRNHKATGGTFSNFPHNITAEWPYAA